MRYCVLILTLALAVACSKDKKQEQTGTPAVTGETPEPAAGQPSQPPTNPHAASPGAASPGAANPHAANPHAGGMPTGGAPAGAAPTKDDQGRYTVGSLKLKAPDDWTAEAPTSGMRKAQFSLPVAKGDSAPTELVIYHFGNAGAGSVQANLDRWYGQFKQPDGSDSKAKAKTDTLEVAGMKVTTVDVSGHYVAAMMPGTPEKHDKPAHRMLAAIIEAPDGAYYFKLIGPEKSVAAQQDAFTAAIKSIEK